MSIHSSLRSTSTLAGERSVFTRVERLAILKKEGKFNEADGNVYGLPKVRTALQGRGRQEGQGREGRRAGCRCAGCDRCRAGRCRCRQGRARSRARQGRGQEGRQEEVTRARLARRA
jgi:small basic protein (TIGR04137 family)